jgi:cytochrome c
MKHHTVKAIIWLLPLTILLINCTGRRDETRILYFAGSDQYESQLVNAAAPHGWVIEKVSGQQTLTEDFIQGFSGIVLTFSALNDLDHRSVVTLKRYLEAGGGGIVAIKDTLHAQDGWLWLEAWNDMQAGETHEPDNSRLSILAPDFTPEHLRAALTYAIGNNSLPDYNLSTTLRVPDASRFTYRVLSQGMDEPMQMAILPDNNVLFVERKGAVKLFDDSSKQTKTIAQFDVFSGIEDGLLGVALDPHYSENNWVYFYYAVAGDKSINRLSRMELRGEELVPSSEKILLEIPTQRIYCCHSAGYIGFGPDGLLYLSTGDNTNAEDTEGYVPIDERPGRELSDDQATAANTNDLRGKILRIRPEADGSYSIPDGNLFPKDGSQGRPEIYIMGCRNPYRFSVDKKNSFLYWGDVGPDTKVQASEGTLSYDEINQARGPGFFGWPYFLGENEAFPHYDFASKKEGPKFNPERPMNQSPNNTGIKQLPPAQPAMIWYGDGSSTRFPLLGRGGESAMAGPVYYSDLFPNAPHKLSDYYDEKLFIYDWVRRWFMAVTLDENGDYLRMEPFLDHIEFVAPTDMQFASDGAIYILEYGTNWFAKNSDARLIRIEYSEGNRKPVANIEASSLYSAAPFEVRFSASSSKDYDEKDKLEYRWEVAGVEAEGEEFVHTFSEPGTYQVTLKVMDNHGGEGSSVVEVKAGNSPPDIDIATTANRTFYWDDVDFDYNVRITDSEDKVIDPERVNISLDYLPRGKDVAVILANPRAAGNVAFAKGQSMVADLDCRACHSVDLESVGPSYRSISKRYAGKSNATEELVQKIIHGGSGNWGDRPMSSHPDLSVADAAEMVRYILSLSGSGGSLPLKNTVALNTHLGKGGEGSYLLMASYTDNGANGIEPLYTNEHVTLRSPLIQIEDFDEGTVRLGTITTEFLTFATGIHHKSFVKFNRLDLSHVKQLRYRIQQNGIGGKIEVRLDAKEGKSISTLNVSGGRVEDLKRGWKEVGAKLDGDVSGLHDVYLVFENPEGQNKNLFNIDWVYFGNRNE